MDLNIIITSAIIIAFCIVPMILVLIKQKSKKKRAVKMLSAIARTKSCEIATLELCGELGVGITVNNEAFVFYNKHENGSEDKYCIVLSEVKNCNFIRMNLDSGSGKIRKLILNFEYRDKSKNSLSLEFYNIDENFQLAGELQMIEKWKPIIDRAIDYQSAKLQMNHSQKRQPMAIAV